MVGKKKMKKSYASKWALLGVSQQDRNKISERIRGNAKQILSQKHLKEFEQIKKRLLDDEYKRLKDLIYIETENEQKRH